MIFERKEKLQFLFSSVVKNFTNSFKTTWRCAFIRRKNFHLIFIWFSSSLCFTGDVEWTDESRGEQLFLFVNQRSYSSLRDVQWRNDQFTRFVFFRFRFRFRFHFDRFAFVFQEKYFDMNKKQCREGLEIYKKFLDRTDKVSHFLKTAEVKKENFSDRIECFSFSFGF